MRADRSRKVEDYRNDHALVPSDGVDARAQVCFILERQAPEWLRHGKIQVAAEKTNIMVKGVVHFGLNGNISLTPSTVVLVDEVD